jgi:hypothetical protein
MIFNKLDEGKREGMKAIRPRPEEKERRKKGRKEEMETECRKNHYYKFSRQ